MIRVNPQKADDQSTAESHASCKFNRRLAPISSLSNADGLSSMRDAVWQAWGKLLCKLSS